MPRPSRHPQRPAQLPPGGRQIKANKTPFVDFSRTLPRLRLLAPVRPLALSALSEKVGCRDAAVAASSASERASARRCDRRGPGFSARRRCFSTRSSRRSNPEKACTVRWLRLFPAACPCPVALLWCAFGVVWGPFQVVRATCVSVFWLAEAWGPFFRGASRARRQVLSDKEVMLSSRPVPRLGSCQAQELCQVLPYRNYLAPMSLWLIMSGWATFRTVHPLGKELMLYS
jgi:hypothetical protein